MKLFPKPHHDFLPGTPTRLRHLYNMQLADRGYQELLNASVPIVGTWDDHDYGWDNSDKTYPYREESQAAFMDFIGEPAGSPRRTQKGVYTSHMFDFGNGIPGRKVLVILLDLRYNKDPYTTPNGDFLGEEQWNWLDKTLRESNADVNLLVSSLQFLADRRILGHNVAGENWYRFEDKRTKFLHLLGRYNVSAPIFLSGDVHFAELSLATSEAGQILEVTSSGMTHSWGTRQPIEGSSKFSNVLEAFGMHTAMEIMPWDYQINDRKTGRGQQYSLDYNFGELEFDWENRTVTTNIRGPENALLLTQSFPLNELGLIGERLGDFGPVGGAPSDVLVVSSALFLLSCVLLPPVLLCLLALRLCNGLRRRKLQRVECCLLAHDESMSEEDSYSSSSASEDREALVDRKLQE